MRRAYTKEELLRLTVESTDCSLIRWENPFSNDPKIDETRLRNTISELMKHYGDEIWSVCLGAGGQGNQNGPSGLTCLAKLDKAFQVYNKNTFEEFLVRNAIKHAALQLVRA